MPNIQFLSHMSALVCIKYIELGKSTLVCHICTALTCVDSPVSVKINEMTK